MNTITATINAYITDYSSVGPKDFAHPTSELISNLYYCTEGAVPKGWTLAGEATITVNLVDQDTLIGNKVAALRGQLQKHCADSYVVEKRLQEQIAKLLAISYEPQS